MTTNNMTNTPFPLAKISGGTALTTEKSIIQIVSGAIVRTSAQTTTIPFDNTKPQNTEGTQLGTCTITPKAASNILEVYAYVHFVSGSGTAQAMTIALFQDSGVDALKTTFGIAGMPTNTRLQLQLCYRVVAGSTSATTFKLRGGNNTATPWYVNAGSTGAQLWGDTDETAIYITEIEA